MAGLTVLLVVVWIGSRWEFLYWENMNSGWFSVGRGQVAFSPPLLGASKWRDGNFFVGKRNLPFTSWFDAGIANGARFHAVPLWFPALLSLLATAAAWRFDAKYLRRVREGACSACGYDRAGLAAGAVCPECGKQPEAR